MVVNGESFATKLRRRKRASVLFNASNNFAENCLYVLFSFWIVWHTTKNEINFNLKIFHVTFHSCSALFRLSMVVTYLFIRSLAITKEKHITHFLSYDNMRFTYFADHGNVHRNVHKEAYTRCHMIFGT